MSRSDPSCGGSPYFNLSIAPTLPVQSFRGGDWEAEGTERATGGTGDRYSMWSSTDGSTVYIQGTTGVALASAFHWYLKYYCKCSLSWLGDQLCLPEEHPYVEPIEMQSPYQYGYYMNTCTFGYSTVWWTWDRWEQEIDWMAMNGVNLPLAFIGQEYVWQNVWLLLGIPPDELHDFFGGPAFLPWQRMGNEDGWPSPLPQSWILKQHDLQVQILERMRSFNMKPILPAFAGHVPAALKSHYPDADVTQLVSWSPGFNGTYFLDPFDPLFATIGSLMIKELEDTYGTDSFYSCDPFNEEIPPSNDTAYLSQVSSTIYSSMATTDPNAVWVLQGWFLVYGYGFWGPAQAEAFLSAVDNSKMLMLDLWAEVSPIWNTGMFFGKPFIWNMLHNFGGRPGMYAVLDAVATGPPTALAQTTSNIVGTGYTPEAIETNPVVYDLMSEMHWRSTAPDLDTWIADYAVRRYGYDSANIKQAWALLQNSIFACHTSQGGPNGIIAGARPDLEISIVGCCANMQLYWDPVDICNAWSLLLAESDSLADQPAYGNDVVQVALQALANIMTGYHDNLVSAFQSGDLEAFEDLAQKITSIITDMDTLLATQEIYLLGKWLSDAKGWATDEAEALAYQYNARLQVTIWGYPLTPLNDYAYKMWAGLTKSFHMSRWQTFVDSLRPFVGNPGLWDHEEYLQQVGEVERLWTTMTDDDSYPDQIVGSSVQVAQSMFDKYWEQC
ncbi:alpha-N-acetylglucosaminidase [Pelomyxa schiedti]|nr:alpha-N-acetylglucosaminidase [Pelomyxa schiedti]